MLTLRIETEEELRQFKALLDRALNCLEPEKWPPWAAYLEDQVTKSLETSSHGTSKVA